MTGFWLAARWTITTQFRCPTVHKDASRSDVFLFLEVGEISSKLFDVLHGRLALLTFDDDRTILAVEQNDTRTFSSSCALGGQLAESTWILSK